MDNLKSDTATPVSAPVPAEASKKFTRELNEAVRSLSAKHAIRPALGWQTARPEVAGEWKPREEAAARELAGMRCANKGWWRSSAAPRLHVTSSRQ
jgi:hypothetical protein